MRRVCVPVLALALLAAGPRPAGAALAPLSGIRAEGGKLLDAGGRTVILRGVNVMDKVLGADGNLDPELSDADLARIAGIGFNVIRLGTSWAAIEPAPGVYDDAFIGRFRGLMDRAYAAGLLVVVDMHQDVWGESLGGNGAPAWATPSCHVPPRLPLAQATGQWFAQYFSPDIQAAFSNFWADNEGDPFCIGERVRTRFVAMWAHLASRLAGHPALAGYDLYNEPWPGTPPPAFELAQLYPFYEDLVAAIRAGDEGAVIFFEPPIQKSGGAPVVPWEAAPPNASYAPHVYTETMFSGGALSTHAATDEIVLSETEAEADSMGVPVWIGEWGAFENAASATYQREFYDMLDAHQAGGAYWHYTVGYGDGLQPLGPAAEAGHRRVYPEAFPGEGEWSYRPDRHDFRMALAVTGEGPHELRVVAPDLERWSPRIAFVQGAGSFRIEGNRVLFTLQGPGTYGIWICDALVEWCR